MRACTNDLGVSMKCFGDDDEIDQAPHERIQMLVSKMDLSFAKSKVLTDRIVCVLDLHANRLQIFKAALQQELNRAELSPLARRFTEERTGVTHQNTDAGAVFRQHPAGPLSWQEMLVSIEGDLVFVYDGASEKLVLLFNHGLLDGMSAVEALVRINSCRTIKSLNELPALSNNPITVGKAIIHYTQRMLEVKQAQRESPILNWWKGAKHVSHTVNYPELRATRVEQQVSYSAMMIHHLLHKFELQNTELKLCISLAHKPKPNVLNNFSFVFIEYSPGMTPQAVEVAIRDKAWEAPMISTVMHNLDMWSSGQQEGNSSLADVCFSLVPGQREDSGELFDSAFVHSWNTTMPMYICCVRYGDTISVATSFNLSVMARMKENEQALQAAESSVPEPAVVGGGGAPEEPKSFFDAMTCGIFDGAAGEDDM